MAIGEWVASFSRVKWNVYGHIYGEWMVASTYGELHRQAMSFLQVTRCREREKLWSGERESARQSKLEKDKAVAASITGQQPACVSWLRTAARAMEAIEHLF
jgi:hypothetical protein